MRRLSEILDAQDATEVGVHLPGIAARAAVMRVCRDAGKRVVALDALPRVVVTADGVAERGIVRCLKDEVDLAVPEAELVIVLRHLGPAALAPTLDAYLDVTMVEGRDVFIDQVGASGYSFGERPGGSRS